MHMNYYFPKLYQLSPSLFSGHMVHSYHEMKKSNKKNLCIIINKKYLFLVNRHFLGIAIFSWSHLTVDERINIQGCVNCLK